MEMGVHVYKEVDKQKDPRHLQKKKQLHSVTLEQREMICFGQSNTTSQPKKRAIPLSV